MLFLNLVAIGQMFQFHFLVVIKCSNSDQLGEFLLKTQVHSPPLKEATAVTWRQSYTLLDTALHPNKELSQEVWKKSRKTFLANWLTDHLILIFYFYPVQDNLFRDGAIQSGLGCLYINYQLRQIPTDMPTGQIDLDNFSVEVLISDDCRL